jgi:hypothetical protein
MTGNPQHLGEQAFDGKKQIAKSVVREIKIFGVNNLGSEMIRLRIASTASRRGASACPGHRAVARDLLG